MNLFKCLGGKNEWENTLGTQVAEKYILSWDLSTYSCKIEICEHFNISFSHLEFFHLFQA